MKWKYIGTQVKKRFQTQGTVKIMLTVSLGYRKVHPHRFYIANTLGKIPIII